MCVVGCRGKRGPYHVTRVLMQVDARNAHTAARRKTSEISLFVCCSYRRIGDGLSHSVRAVVVVDVMNEIGQKDRERQREEGIVVDKRFFITRPYAQVTLIHDPTAGDPHIAISVKTVYIMVLCSKNQPSA